VARIGASPEELTQLKSVFDTQSDRITDLINAVASKLNSVDWQGPAHDRFKNQWDGDFMKTLRNLQQALQDAGREAHQVGDNIRKAGS
jgi:WXG100 family type VII secretion target